MSELFDDGSGLSELGGVRTCTCTSVDGCGMDVVYVQC